MTRTLPWTRRSSTNTEIRRPAGTTTPKIKRPRPKPLDPSSDIDDDAATPTDGRDVTATRGREPSTSPPPEAPEESFMEDGFDHDDRYRMVEDEFLDAAKEFTRHLHAREYARMKKAARSQNAATINSISRPVTMRMPDQTKRKVESVARSKKQATSLRGLLGKQRNISESDEDSDGAGSVWLGTALHGLMESPRKSSATLATLGSFNSATRAAAGFKRSYSSALVEDSATRSPQTIPKSNKFARLPPVNEGNETESSDDDDLDARPQRSSPAATKAAHSSLSTSGSTFKNLRHIPPILSERPTAESLLAPSKDRSAFAVDLQNEKERTLTEERSERARRIRARQDEKAGKKPKDEQLDEIPIFL